MHCAPHSAPKAFTYFIQAEGGGPIKIGIAAGPRRRLAELQTAHHATLRLLGFAPGYQERRLHNRFASHRLRGEWFNPDPSILECMATVCAAPGGWISNASGPAQADHRLAAADVRTVSAGVYFYLATCDSKWLTPGRTAEDYLIGMRLQQPELFRELKSLFPGDTTSWPEHPLPCSERMQRADDLLDAYGKAVHS